MSARMDSGRLDAIDELPSTPPKFGDQPCPPPCGKHTVNRHASLIASRRAGLACNCGPDGCDNCRAETRTFLDMFGLPPYERPLRTSRGERNRAGVYGEDK